MSGEGLNKIAFLAGEREREFIGGGELNNKFNFEFFPPESPRTSSRNMCKQYL